MPVAFMASWNLRPRCRVAFAVACVSWPVRVACQVRTVAAAPAGLTDRVTAVTQTGGLTIRLFEPDVRFIRNSDIPYSMNDGPLWAGRGVNVSATLGVAGGYGWERFRVNVAVA